MRKIGQPIGDADLNEDDAVLFAESMPWHLSETEKALSEQKLDEIIRKYTDELSGGQIEPGYIRMEFYG